MKFTETQLKGAFILELEKRGDDRGFFARTWCQHEFQDHGLAAEVVQQNISVSKDTGTLRGMHYQIAPHQETKLIRCSKGALYDVIIDLRPDSATYKQWLAFELTQDNYKMVYVPKDFAHGFMTLADDTEATYLVSAFYAPNAERGIRYNDSAFGIHWPLPVTTISDKDNTWPDYKD
ncbi:MAG: dTDP-4-dehydrorhamnose 3,5-epimerase [bacterium]